MNISFIGSFIGIKMKSINECLNEKSSFIRSFRQGINDDFLSFIR